MEEEVVEVETMKKQNSHSPAVSTPPQLQIHSPNSTSFPKSPFGSRFMNTPIASPMKKAIENMFEEVAEFTRFDPRDDWLPITACRNGNAYYAAFHLLCSGIGFQALVLPLAFTTLGWSVTLILSFMVINSTIKKISHSTRSFKNALYQTVHL